jgi:hypothetical protein
LGELFYSWEMLFSSYWHRDSFSSFRSLLNIPLELCVRWSQCVMNLISFDLFLPFQQWLDPNKRVLQQLKGKYCVTFREFFILSFTKIIYFLHPVTRHPLSLLFNFNLSWCPKTFLFFSNGNPKYIFFFFKANDKRNVALRCELLSLLIATTN